MSKSIQIILALVAIAGATALGASTFELGINWTDTMRAPAWYWILYALVVMALALGGLARDAVRAPSRTDVITTLILALVALLLTVSAPAGSLLKITGTVTTFLFLLLGGSRFVRMVMPGAKR